jgi:diguanylate cyclase (GGDEF)-like protein/PAS domain S-box-containing protein
MPQVTVLNVAGPDGTVLYSTRSFPAPALSMAPVPHFIAHRDQPGLGLLINPPRKSLYDGKWSIYFSRGIYDAGNRFRGVITALVDPSYFQEFYRDISLGEGSAVALFRSDGIMLTRFPLREEWLGKSFAHGEVYTQILSREPGHGVIHARSVVDNVDRIISAHRLADYPLAVNVSITQSSALQEWRQWAEATAAGALVAIAVIAGLLLKITLQFRNQERLTAELQTSDRQLQEAQRIASLGSWTLHCATDRITWSDETRRMLSWPAEKPPPTRVEFLSLVDESDRPRAARFLQKQAAAEALGPLEDNAFRFTGRDGEIRWLQLAAHPAQVEHGRSQRVDGTIMDITDRRAAEERLRLAASVFERSAEGNMVMNAALRIISVNHAFSRITGHEESEAIGRTPRFLGSGRRAKGLFRSIWTNLLAEDQWEGETWMRSKHRESFPCSMSIKAVRDGGGRVTHYIAIFSDITERKQQQEEIWRQAHFDALTGLANRNLFNDRLDRALVQARRNHNKVGVIFLDLDGFKWINDTLGHAIGDELLVTVGRRLQSCVRDEDTVSRAGGDEFTLAIQDLHDPEDLVAIGEKIIAILREPFMLAGVPCRLTGSVGVTVFPDDGDGVEVLLKNADIAMYRAKQAGKNRIQFYAHQMQADAMARMQIETDLREALLRREFSLHYQPIVDSVSGDLVGAEALIRWRHPQRGFVEPLDFIPTAEDSGLIIEIGEWVLREAARQLKAWHAAGYPRLRVAVNVSAAQFRTESFSQVLGSLLAEHAIEAGVLMLEITESVLMDDSATTEARMQAIKEQGVGYSLDDFGTGYSSLSYLKRFPVDIVKIDRSFVRDCPEDRSDAHLVQAIIDMAHGLGLKVTAEGVETEEQASFLRKLGCDYLQGYLISRPIPVAEFETLMQRRLPA